MEVGNEDDDAKELEALEEEALDPEEEEEAVAAAAAEGEPLSDGDEVDENLDPLKREIAQKERQRLRELKRKKKAEIDAFLTKQNEEISADNNLKTKGRLNFLLQHTKIFAHFAKDHGDYKKHMESINKDKNKRRSELDEEEEDEVYLKEEEEALGEEPASSGVRLLTQPKCITGKMRDYQLAGLNWLIRLYENGINGILADEMGLGKTLQTISLLGYLMEYKGIRGPHLVVAPKSTLGNWVNEINRFCPSLRAFKFLGNPDERKNLKNEMLVAGRFDVVVTSYEMVIREKSAFNKFYWRYIIIDEAHRIKNENSLLSKTMRLFSSNYRLLITGTPLQNNLHELWALLNFLLPEIFSSAETFDEWFQISGENDEAEIVQQLHKVLRPFLLRRLKSDVERGLPPKKETILKVGMSIMQKNLYRALLQKDTEVINSGGDRARLLNIAMQLRKCCNHPYLFKGTEPGPPFLTGEHLVENSGKMILLDKLLKKLKERGSRVLIFSQMTRLLDILEDYLVYRSHIYCRIDGNTCGDEREAYIDSFNKPESDIFVFLLSTRAGGLGINLATADTVIIYDSDWNPQADLQAMDRAHRIGQKKEVQVFRFCTEYTIEEKVIERAYKKLALDALVIQQGRLSEQKAVKKEELLQMVRYGAEKIFSQGADSIITDEDIDGILAKGEKSTAELNAKMKKFTEDAIKFKMDDSLDLYNFGEAEAEKENVKTDFKRFVSDNMMEPSRRERKRIYTETEYYRQRANNQTTQKTRESKMNKIAKMPALHDFQFFNIPRLTALYEKEVKLKLQAKEKERIRNDSESKTESNENPENDVTPNGLSGEEEKEKQTLLEQGFRNWTRKEYVAFTRLCEKYGRKDIKSIASEMETKTESEVLRYSQVFWKRYKELNDWEKVVKSIERGEARIARKEEIMKAIAKKLDRYTTPMHEMHIHYAQNKGKHYTEFNDRFLICTMHRVGYGNWEKVHEEIRSSPLFSLDWFLRARSVQEIARRCDMLVRLIEKENLEIDERERKLRRETSKKTFPQKRKQLG